MGTHRYTTRIVTVIAGGAAALAALVGHDLLHFHPDDVHPPVMHLVAPQFLPSLKDIPGVASEINEASEGPVRDAVVQTACDAMVNRHYDANYEWKDLVSNLADGTEPPEERLLGAVSDLVGTLSQAEKNGVTTPEAVETACDAYSIHGNLG